MLYVYLPQWLHVVDFWRRLSAIRIEQSFFPFIIDSDTVAWHAEAVWIMAA